MCPRTHQEKAAHDAERVVAAMTRRQRLDGLGAPRPFQPSCPWNGSTNVHSKKVVPPTAEAKAARDADRAAAAMARRQRVDALNAPRPFLPPCPWDGSVKIAGLIR